LPDPFAPGEIGILIAEAPDQTDHARQIIYETAITDRMRAIPTLQDAVKVSLIERPLPFDLKEQQTEAIKIGRWLNASFVLRPFTIEGEQEPRLTVVNHSDFFHPESRIGDKFQNTQLANLDQLSLPKDLALLAETSLALAFGERQSYARAAQILGDVLKSSKLPDAAPSRWALNHLRGNNLLFSGNSTEAIAEYRQAIHLNPDFAGAHNDLGVALVAEGHHDEAIAEFKEAIRLQPDNAEAYNNLGACPSNGHLMLEESGQV